MKLLSKLATLYAGLGLLAGVFTAGCVSEDVTIVSAPKAGVVSLGTVEGSGAGVLAPGVPVLDFIPIGLNERVQNAHDDALSKTPGATALKNVTLQESWYFIGVGTLRYVTITGEAVK
jgi:hypothetical protein